MRRHLFFSKPASQFSQERSYLISLAGGGARSRSRGGGERGRGRGGVSSPECNNGTRYSQNTGQSASPSPTLPGQRSGNLAEISRERV